jgi:hypothetical protein
MRSKFAVRPSGKTLLIKALKAAGILLQKNRFATAGMFGIWSSEFQKGVQMQIL